MMMALNDKIAADKVMRRRVYWQKKGLREHSVKKMDPGKSCIMSTHHVYASCLCFPLIATLFIFPCYIFAMRVMNAINVHLSFFFRGR